MAWCRDCRGSGKYTGLHTVEDCRTCGGSGDTNPKKQPDAKFVRLVQSLRAARDAGDAFMVLHYLDEVSRYGGRHSNQLPGAMTQDQFFEGIDHEIEAIHDIMNAAEHLQAALITRRIGFCYDWFKDLP